MKRWYSGQIQLHLTDDWSDVLDWFTSSIQEIITENSRLNNDDSWARNACASLNRLGLGGLFENLFSELLYSEIEDFVKRNDSLTDCVDWLSKSLPQILNAIFTADQGRDIKCKKPFS